MTAVTSPCPPVFIPGVSPTAPPCPRCHTSMWVMLTSTGAEPVELGCSGCGERWWPIPPHVPFIDPDRESGKPGRPLRTHCVRGHAFPTARRECYVCRAESRKAWKQRQQAARGEAA